VSRTPPEQHPAIRDKVPALTKTIAIIRCLNDLSAAGASLQEVAERLQITKLDFGQKFNGLAMVRKAKYGACQFL